MEKTNKRISTVRIDSKNTKIAKAQRKKDNLLNDIEFIDYLKNII